MTQWVSVKVSREETLYINIANIVKVSRSLGQTILHYVNGETELLSNQQAGAIVDMITGSLANAATR
jgi:hypothetical protein